MATTIDYGSDYGTDSIDYQTTMAEDSPMAIDYDRLSRGKLCPLKATEPPDLDAILRVGAIKCRTDGEPPAWSISAGSVTAPAAPGGMRWRSAAPSSPWPGTNDNAPACS